jgi:hypothetical protein
MTQKQIDEINYMIETTLVTLESARSQIIEARMLLQKVAPWEVEEQRKAADDEFNAKHRDFVVPDPFERE